MAWVLACVRIEKWEVGSEEWEVGSEEWEVGSLQSLGLNMRFIV